jgi:3-methyladenine DNA glycosylase AlkD
MKSSATSRNFFALVIITVFSLLASACATTDPYASISVGDTRAKVVSLLGKPVNPAKELTAAELETISRVLRKTHNNSSDSFTIWRHGDKYYYLIGFSKKDTVAVKHRLLNLSR